jgi:zinc D-Ala-D-Ala dipeptidase
MGERLSQRIDRPLHPNLTKHKVDMPILFRKLKPRFKRRWIISVLLVLSVFVAAQSLAAEDEKLNLVDIKSVDPSIVIDLRYAGTHNSLHRRLYPPSMRALVQASVAKQLVGAQDFLRRYRYGLKIWDAYRPKSAQRQLWGFVHDEAYVTNPDDGVGSLHTWGVAVDATLVGANGGSVLMPTDFDDFTPAAMLHYHGMDFLIRSHLRLLQTAMGRNRFYGLHTEWWHFISQDWKNYVPSREAHMTEQASKGEATDKL